jgi:hypothetical protein
MEISNFNLLVITIILFSISQIQIYNIKLHIENFIDIQK